MRRLKITSDSAAPFCQAKWNSNKLKMLNQQLSVDNQEMISTALHSALEIIRRTIPQMQTNRPKIGRPDLTYVHCGDTDWVDGFWSGQLWLAYSCTQDVQFFKAAREQQPYFAERIKRPESHDHDLGFLYSLSCVADYKLTKSEVARDLAVEAARSLILRFNPSGQFIRAWNEWPGDSPEFKLRKRGKIIVDCMENLALLYWASQITGEAQFSEIATAHANTVITHVVRPDNSTYHTYDFDPTTGQPIGGFTAQGYADESCWSRGQAWAIHGFAQTYAYTSQTLYKETACRLADYAINNLPEDFVPYWDYRLPAQVEHYRDSSAGAITSSGLFLLADLLEKDHELEKAAQYREVAWKMLAALIEGYTTIKFEQAEGLLLHGASHVSAGYADNMLPYGDYFYLEALLRARRQPQVFFW